MEFQYHGILRYPIVCVFTHVAVFMVVTLFAPFQLPTSESPGCPPDLPPFHTYGNFRNSCQRDCRICNGTSVWSDVDPNRTQWERGTCMIAFSCFHLLLREQLQAAPLIFALVKVESSYWAMIFLVMILVGK